MQQYEQLPPLFGAVLLAHLFTLGELLQALAVDQQVQPLYAWKIGNADLGRLLALAELAVVGH